MPRNALLVVGNLYKARLFSFLDNQVGINTVYYLCTSIVGVAPTEGDAADELSSTIGPELRALMTNTAQYVGADVQNVSGVKPFPLQSGSLLSSGIGAAGTDPLPTQVSGCITFQTDFTGQAYRGRFYVPFPDNNENAVVPPIHPNAGYITGLNAMAVSLVVGLSVSPIVGTHATMALVLKHGINKAGLTPPPTPITNFRSNPKWATQRRRGNYGRSNLFPVP